MNIQEALDNASKAAAGITKLAAGNYVGGAVDLLDAAFALIPEDELRAHLDAAAVRRQNAIADALERARGLK